MKLGHIVAHSFSMLIKINLIGYYEWLLLQNLTGSDCIVDDFDQEIRNLYLTDSAHKITKTSKEITIYFEANPKFLENLISLNLKLIKTQDNSFAALSPILWGSKLDGRFVCGNLCCFRKTFNARLGFYQTISAALQYQRWMMLRSRWRINYSQYNPFTSAIQYSSYNCPFIFDPNK